MTPAAPGPTRAAAEGSAAARLSRERPLERRLRDGTPVRLRLMDARDRERLRNGFEQLSPESRYRRFLTPVPRLTEGMLRRLTDTDHIHHVAVGAERGGFHLGTRDGLGVARFIRLKDSPDTAELAVAVIDAMQGRGLGRLLVQALSHVARDRGVRRFRAFVLPDNRPIQNLLYELDPDAEVRFEDGLQAFHLDVPEVDLDAVGVSSRGLLGIWTDLLSIAG